MESIIQQFPSGTHISVIRQVQENMQRQTLNSAVPPASSATERVNAILLNSADNTLQEQRHMMATQMASVHFTSENNRKCYDPKVVEFMVFIYLLNQRIGWRNIIPTNLKKSQKIICTDF